MSYRSFVSKKRVSYCIAAVVPFALAFAGFPTAGYAQEVSVDPSVSLQALRECYKKPTEIIRCGTEEVKKLLRGRTGKEVMGFLEDMPEYMCHQFGHVVGREVYKRTGDLEKAMNECVYGCGGACFHGTVEAAFLERLGIDPESAPDIHPDEEQILANAKEFCRNATMCHGIGHMLFQLYNSFDEPLAICADIAKGVPREDCYWGVFMDHAMMYSTYNLLLGSAKKQTYNASDLLSPCNEVDKEYRHACYRYQPRLQYRMFDELGVQDTGERLQLQRAACETLEISDRLACFEGLGRAFLTIGISNTELPRAWSESLASTTDRTAFARGMIRSMVAHGYTSNSFAYCAALRVGYERWSCYYNSLIALIFVAVQQITAMEPPVSPTL